MNGLQPWLPAQDSPEVIVNENFEALSHMATYAKDPATTAGLSWGYLGGRWGGFAIIAGTLTLTASSTIYITVNRSTGVISASASGANWDDTDSHARVYKVAVGTATVISAEDHRAGLGGVYGISSTPSAGGAVPVVVVVAATGRNVTPSDAGAYLRFTSAGAKTADFNVANGYSVNQEYHITNRAASGDLTLGGTGVTLNAPKGGTLVLEPGDIVTVKFVDVGEADVFGGTKGGA